MRWIIRAALADVMPSGGHVPGILDTEWDQFFDQYLQETSWTMWAALCAGALLYVLTPVLTVYWPLPSVMLPQKLRDLHAHRIMNHPIYLLRQAVFLLKLPAGFCWGAHPRVRAQLNLPNYRPDPGSWRSE